MSAFRTELGFRIFGIESVSHHRVRAPMEALLAHSVPVVRPPAAPSKEFYFADGLIIRGKYRRPASAPGCHVATAQPTTTGRDHHHYLLALQQRSHLFAHRVQNGMNSFGGCGWLFVGRLY